MSQLFIISRVIYRLMNEGVVSKGGTGFLKGASKVSLSSIRMSSRPTYPS